MQRTNPTSGNWTPDLFNGAGKQREPGKDRADDMRRAGAEMRDSGSSDLFDAQTYRDPLTCAECGCFLSNHDTTCSHWQEPATLSFKRNGLSSERRGQDGYHGPCKHILAVRLYCELVKASRERPRGGRRTKLLLLPSPVASLAASYHDSSAASRVNSRGHQTTRNPDRPGQGWQGGQHQPVVRESQDGQEHWADENVANQPGRARHVWNDAAFEQSKSAVEHGTQEQTHPVGG
jgi:hypothetical protein